jgi:hypothetical protein
LNIIRLIYEKSELSQKYANLGALEKKVNNGNKDAEALTYILFAQVV